MLNLKILKSRLQSFVDLGIDLPTDDLLRVILTKSFSDIQIKVDIKLLEYILKNIERSYEKYFNLLKILIKNLYHLENQLILKLIKKVLNNE